MIFMFQKYSNKYNIMNQSAKVILEYSYQNVWMSCVTSATVRNFRV